jgi:glycosyltransferase involved in cell wall biosynthesis
MKIGIVVPHIFMHRQILPKVIFSPATLALDLCEGLRERGAEVTLFSPGPVDPDPVNIDASSAAGMPITNITADLSYFEQELAGRGDTYLDLLKKHPFTFVTLARQVQSELIAKAFAMANNGELDLVHIYTNEEDIALPFAALCTKPVVFTHHDPFNFLVKYKNVFPKYAGLNWISTSLAQRKGMPPDTNWVANIFHGLRPELFTPNYRPTGGYVGYLGRIIESKGTHLAIQAVKKYNAGAPAGQKLKLKIAGKHYAGHHKDTYWQERILPLIDGDEIEYAGFISSPKAKQDFLGNAAALIIPSTFEEPFGMVMIEALACGTPLVGLNSGAIPEVIKEGETGFVIAKTITKQKTTNSQGLPQTRGAVDESKTAADLAAALKKIPNINRHICRQDFETRFTQDRMCDEHLAAYERVIKS